MARLLISILAVLSTLALPVHATDIDLTRIADGVYAAVRREPPGLTFVSNTVFILEADHAIVVDTGIGQATAAASIAALKSLTDKPVRYLINTHWHDDHHLGNAAWRAAYPGALVVAHANAVGELAGTGEANRKELLKEGPAFAQEIRNALAKNLNLAGKPISAEERESFAADLTWAERYFRDTPSTPILLPDLEVGERLVLRGKRRVEILYLGRAHTASDLVVWLPEERIAVTGDLVVWPIPLFGS
ncbi:MAG TPA: MBL fold metallo-hydrolase, partial [Usitatibacteraceae bacterium]|nr:MBL fold metallo-hydrolase [Usitatibacteraceae bacterium]